MSARKRASTVSASEPGDVARLREALASARGETANPVDAGRIFDALHGDVTPEDRRAVVDELITSPDAAEAWRLARELAPPVSAPSVTRQDRGAWRWWSAAAAVLALGVAWQFVAPWRTVEPPAYRSTEQRAIASLLPSGQPLSRNAPVLRWTGIDGARYRVTVLTPALDVIEEANNLGAPEYTISPDGVARFPPGAPLLWQVEARIPGEGSLVSPTFTVRVE
jgi:hypothetical protein